MAASTPSSFTTSSTTTPPLRASAAASQMDPNAIPSPGGGGTHSYNLAGSHSTPAHLHSPPSSVAHSPSSVNESPTSYHQPQHQHAYYQTQQPPRNYSSYSHMPQKEHSYYPLPPDSFPRTISKGAFDQDRLLHQLPSPSIPSSYSRPHYQLHQSSYPPTSSSRLHSRTHSYEDLPPSNSGNGSGRSSGIISGLPEYSYPMGPPPRLNRSLHPPSQHRLQHEYPPPTFHRHRQENSDNGNPQERQFLLQSEQPQSQRAPLSIHTPRSASDVLPLRSGPGLSINTRTADSQFSSATPRSLPMSASIRQSFTDLCAYTESPVEERDFSGHRHTIPGAARGKYDNGNYDMEQYSELDGFHASESEDEHDEDGTLENHGKRQKLGNGGSRPLPYNTTVPFSRGESDIAIERQNTNINAIGEEYGEEGGSHLESTIGVSGSVPGDDRPQRRGRKPKNAAQKRGSRRTSLPMSPADPNDQTEGDANNGPQSLSGKGLRIYAQRVCDRVKAKGSTSYNELVHDLFGGNAGDDEDNVPEAAKQENIRRRVYDALNVLHAIDIIKFENKDICWVGAEKSVEVRDVTEKQTAKALAQDPPEDGGDEESEEPEYDDMDIEELQREVDALKLRNELEQAKLQDQLTRQVQVLNLVKRNKRREERESRRKQLKEERRRATATDQDASMTDVGPQGASDHNDETRRRSDRRRRRQSRRQQGEDGMVDVEVDQEDEETRRRRKQERKERRERKEKQRSERIQLPFVIVRMPGYTGQSSDSESSISVVRRVKSGKGRKSSKSNESGDSTSQETTMVEIQVPQQDELGFMSDTEILGDLGFSTVTMDDLEVMLPKELVEAVQYTVNGDEANHTHSLRSQRRAESGDSVLSADDDIASITVRGGFEREIVRAASESASSTA